MIIRWLINGWKKSPAVLDVAIILALLSAMLVANVDWIFTRPGWLDPWMYFGFFQHYDVSSYLAGNKKIARLPWILVGFAFNKTLPAIPAAFALHVSCFGLGALGLYAVTARLFGRLAAVVTAITYLTWIPIHGPAGWDYHDTLLPVVYFASYLSLLWATSSYERAFVKFTAVGALYALAIHTNILAALLVPALLIRGLHQARSWWRQCRRTGQWLCTSIAGTFAGAAAITVILGAVNLASGRQFLFFDELISRSLLLIRHENIEKAWMDPWSSFWWLKEEHTSMFEVVLVLIAVCALLNVKRWSLGNLLASSAACSMLEFVAVLSLFVAGHVAGHPLLSPFYMLMPAALPLFAALAALVAVTSKTGSDRDHRLSTLVTSVTAVTIAFIVAIQFIGHVTVDPTLFRWRPEVFYNLPPIAITLCGFAVAAILAHFLRTTGFNSALAIGALAVALGQSNTIWPLTSQDWTPYSFRSRCPQDRALLAAVSDFDKKAFELMREGVQVLPWYDTNEVVNTNPDCSLASWQIGGPLFAMGYGFSNLGPWDVRASPKMPLKVATALDPSHDAVAVIGNSDAYVRDVLHRLQRQRSDWHRGPVYEIGRYGLGFRVSIITGSKGIKT